MLGLIHNQVLILALGSFRISPVGSLYMEADKHHSIHAERNSLYSMLAIRHAANP